MPLRFTMLLVLTKAFLRSPAPRATRRVVARAATKSTNGGEWALPDGWRAALGDELASDRFRDLRAFVAAERASHTVYPPPETLKARPLAWPGPWYGSWPTTQTRTRSRSTDRSARSVSSGGG